MTQPRKTSHNVRHSACVMLALLLPACSSSTATPYRDPLRPGMSMLCDGREVRCEALSPLDPYDRDVISGLKQCQEELAALKGDLAPGVSHAKGAE